ncbi:MAG: hypothetical protein ACTSUE_12430 [Promethearchaeota archaeon]
MDLKIDNQWDQRVKVAMQAFLDAIATLDPAAARKHIASLVSLIYSEDPDITDFTRRDARIALELIQQIDHDHPEAVLIESASWKGNLEKIRKGTRTDLKTKNYDRVATLVPRLIFNAEHNEDATVKVKSTEILLIIAKKHPLVLEPFQSRFFRLVFEDNISIASNVASILYAINFHLFPTSDPVKIRDILTKQFMESLVNIWTDWTYHRHFIKYNITIENFTRQWIWDVELRLKKSPSFNLVKVEPSTRVTTNPFDGTDVLDLNVVQHQSTKVISVFLEPTFKPELELDSAVSYKNNDGRVIKKENPKDVIDMFRLVPVFNKDIEVNVTKCKEFFDYKAKIKDSRSFAIKSDASFSSLESALNAAINAESFKIAHEFKSGVDATEGMYFSEVYYYARSTSTNQEFAVVTRISEEEQILVIMIAASDAVFTTGLYNKILSTLFMYIDEDLLFELKCPTCLEPVDANAEFCPWCGYKFPPSK